LGIDRDLEADFRDVLRRETIIVDEEERKIKKKIQKRVTRENDEEMVN
jgi:hypothetical protein